MRRTVSSSETELATVEQAQPPSNAAADGEAADGEAADGKIAAVEAAAEQGHNTDSAQPEQPGKIACAHQDMTADWNKLADNPEDIELAGVEEHHHVSCCLESSLRHAAICKGCIVCHCCSCAWPHL